MTSTAELAAEQTEPPRVALTFDDGPNKVSTKALLEGLKKRDVKASFFLTGRNIIGNEELVKQMHEDGHLIGNHTYDHVHLSRMSEKEACDQITKTNNIIFEITGEYPIFVRPPYGDWKEGVDCTVTMLPIKWTIDPEDWNTENVDLIVSRVEKKVEDGDIILLHDSYITSVEAALRIVDDLIKKGYEFVTVDELLLE